MATSHFQHFTNRATVFDSSNDGTLGRDCLHDPSASWAELNGLHPNSDQAFRAGMHRCGIDAGDSRLRMTGPAADHILYSYPAAA